MTDGNTRRRDGGSIESKHFGGGVQSDSVSVEWYTCGTTHGTHGDR